MYYYIIAFETYEDEGYMVEKYLKGINLRENGKFELDITKNPEGAYRFNDLINYDIEARNSVFNLCKKHFMVLQPKIKKLNITVE